MIQLINTIFFVHINVFNIYQRPREGDQTTAEGGPVPPLAPPPRSPQIAAYADTSPRFNPFDKSGNAQDAVISETAQTAEMARTDSQVFAEKDRTLSYNVLQSFSNTRFLQ